MISELRRLHVRKVSIFLTEINDREKKNNIPIHFDVHNKEPSLSFLVKYIVKKKKNFSSLMFG